MNKLFNLILLIACTLTVGSISAQTVPISQGGTLDIVCGEDPVILTDSDADGGNYTAGEDFVMTFCPVGGNAVNFVINADLGTDILDIVAGDLVTVYDGTDTSAPVLGTFNTPSTPNNFVNYAATVENPTGCLTIQFTSSENSGGGAGFTATMFCGNLWQPFSIELETSPSEMTEGNYIDICQGETVTFTANGDFPYADGNGYDQTNDNSYWEWDLGDGTELEGFGLTEVTNTYTEQFGYPIKITVTDTLGLVQVFEASVRVSTTPNFAGLLAQFQDTICLGANTTLVGGLTPDSTTSFGVAPNPSSFIGGGFLAGQTFLPDGNNVSYETSILIDDFPEDATIEEIENIVAICAVMEHSYMGDLQIEVSCPNGQSVMILSYPNDGGGTYLGDALDDGSLDPGVGYEYCFTADPQYGLLDEVTPVDGSAPEGSYATEEPLTNLIGCPINGEWTITISDNLSIDNGYIFSWGIQFDPLIDPNAETYQPSFVDAYWGDDPSIISGNDTLIVVQPSQTGSASYDFFVSDNFGCDYDTSVVVTVVEPSTSFVTDPACFLQSDAFVTNSTNGGVWSFTTDVEGGVANIFNDTVTVNLPGLYTLMYDDNLCPWTDEHLVNFLPPAVADIPDTMTICQEAPMVITAGEQFPGLANLTYQWTYNGIGGTTILGNEESQEVQLPGIYTLSVYDPACDVTVLDAIEIFNKPCVIQTYNVFTPGTVDGENDVFHIQAIQESLYDGNQLFVYNRWGNVVYEASNYENDWKMEDLVDGTYFFVLNLKDGVKHTGSFTVLSQN